MGNITHLSLLLSRIVIATFACFLLYVALFTYEDEQGRLQNRLDELWIRVDEMRRAATAGHTAFLKSAISLVNAGLDSLYGPKLLSPRSLAVTLSYSIGSLHLLVSYYAYSSPNFGDVMFFGIAILLGTSVLFVKQARMVSTWSWTIILLDIPLLAFGPVLGAPRPFTLSSLREEWTASGEAFLFSTSLAGGVICDVLFIMINRSLLKSAGRVKSGVSATLIVVCNVALGILYMLPYFLSQSNVIGEGWDLIAAISATNMITALVASAIVVVMIAALAHPLFWGLINRPIYAMAQRGVVRRPALLLSVAIMMLTWAFPAWRPFWDWIAKIK